MTIIPDDLPTTPIEAITTAAAALLAEARAAGLVMPFSVSCNDYGPGASLILWATHMDTPAIWAAINQWAAHYQATVTTRPSVNPGSIHAVAAFQREGLNYEVSAIIRPAQPADDADAEEGDAHQDDDGDEAA